MPESKSFAYTDTHGLSDEMDFMPFLPVTLHLGKQKVSVAALLDSGAGVNVLPYSVGLALGANWNEQKIKIALGGSLEKTEARVILVTAFVEDFDPARLVFAWTQHDVSPVILGQTNFFREFDVYFFRARKTFEIRRNNGQI